MTFRQFMVCLIVGPFCAVLFLGAFVMLPFIAAFGWLLGDDDPVMEAWELISKPPLWIFKDAYRGFDA